MKEQKKIRTILFYKNYFKEFYIEQSEAVRRKINYSMSLVETQRIVPKKFFKLLDGTDGIYEIRTEYKKTFIEFCVAWIKVPSWSFFKDSKRKHRKPRNRK